MDFLNYKNILTVILLTTALSLSSILTTGCETEIQLNESYPSNYFLDDCFGQIINGGFESGNFMGWEREMANENSIEICSNPVREGLYSSKLILSPEDYVNMSNRVELVMIDCNTLGQDLIYNFSYMLDKDYEDSDLVQTIQQFHDQPDFSKGEDWSNYTQRPPPISLKYKKQSCLLNIYDIESGLKNIATFKMQKGSWYDFTFWVNWAPDSSGYIQLNVNGAPVTPFNGTDYKYYFPTVYNSSGNYFKVGLYRDKNITTTNIVYVDNFSLKSSNE